MKAITMRHACGYVVHVEIFVDPFEGDPIPAFFKQTDRECVDVPLHECPKCEWPLDLDWCGLPYLIEPMTDRAIQHTVNTKLCSNCWGLNFDIVQLRDDDGSEVGTIVVCRKCQEETIGFVTEQYVTNQRSDDYFNWSTDIEAMSNALGLEPPKRRTQEENLSDLGF